jgi:hypothetical protein
MLKKVSLDCSHRCSDFGLAIELSDKKKVEGGLYKLTGLTGSPRYMAPGRYSDNHYNLTTVRPSY